MESLVSYYLGEQAESIIHKNIAKILESKIDGDEIDVEDVDGDGEMDAFYLDMGNMIDSEIDEESIDEAIKARAPQLRGKAEKARKNKASIMKTLMGSEDVQGAILRLKNILKRKAKSIASSIGVSNRQVQKAFSGKVKI